ncbi:MAG: GntR family transcriptional regulator [Lentisphaeria bacterium]|nr:GntR family transcriptional regulator [Lentisphaeria bacterium]
MALTTSETKRRQVIREITEQICKGQLNPGMRLATIRDMSAHFGVSFSVIQKALYELSNAGFVECRGANGYYVIENIPHPKTTTVKEEKIYSKTDEKIRVFCLHHSDLVWRYPYSEYKKIRESQIKHQLKLAEKYKTFQFGFEQAEILRVYLEDHPEDKKKIELLYKEGRVELFGSFCIPDTNMVSGESLVRNFLAGREIYKSILGEYPVVGCLSDAFGMSVQLPQILSKCGYKYLIPGRAANAPENVNNWAPFQWCAPDGSSVITMRSIPEITHLGYTVNTPEIRSFDEQIVQSLSNQRLLEGNRIVRYMTEEGEFQESLFWAMDALNKTPGRLVSFGRCTDYFEEITGEEMPIVHGEFNPVFTGCYTSRITVKQMNRKAENNLFKAEFLDAVTDRGYDFTALWYDLFRIQFHDGICGCHTDLANQEIMEKLENICSETEQFFAAKTEKTFGVTNFCNESGPQLIVTDGVIPANVESQADSDGKVYFVADLPAYGTRNFKCADKKKLSKTKKCNAKFRTDFYEADFTEPYPVIRNLIGENVFSPDGFGEILCRLDNGTMWTENYLGVDITRTGMEERVVSIDEGPVFINVITEGRSLTGKSFAGNTGNYWPGFGSLKFRKEYIFPKHLDYFKLRITLEWVGNNTHIQVRLPLNLDVSNMMETYSAPFCSLIRKPYFEVKKSYLGSMKQLASQQDYMLAKGNWPALNWVNYSDLRKGLTVANTGTPGHQLVNGNILISLLRSGTGVCDGSMFPQDGSFCNGTHTFEFAICAHSPMDMEKGAALGQMLNLKPEITPSVKDEKSYLNWVGDNIQLSALYKIPDGYVVRMYELSGRKTDIVLNGALLDGRNIYETDMTCTDGVKYPDHTLTFQPFEIKTLIIK